MDEKDLIIKNLQERNELLSSQLVNVLKSGQGIGESVESDDAYKNRLSDFIWRVSDKIEDKDLYQCIIEEFLIELNADRATLMVQGSGPNHSLVVVNHAFKRPITTVPLPYFVQLDSNDPYKKFLDEAIEKKKSLRVVWDEVVEVHPEVSIKSSCARAIELEFDGVWVISLQWFDSVPDWNKQDELLFEEMASYTNIVLEQAHLSSQITDLKNQNESLIESMPSAIIGLDLLGNITFWSGRAQEFFGLEEEDALGFDFEKKVPEFSGISMQLANLIQADEEMVLEPVLYETTTGMKYLQPHLYSMFAKDRGEVALRIDDITKQMEIQDHILHAQKMETIGTIVGDVADNFNNLLSGVVGSASMLLHRSSGDEKITKESKQDLQHVLSCAKQATELANRLIVLSKHNDLEFNTVDLVKCVNNVKDLCKTTFDKEINISTRIDLKDAKVIGIESQIENMLLNICLNSRTAIKEKIAEGELELGNLNLVLRSFEADDEFTIRHSCGDSKYFYRIDIQDNGIGVNDANKIQLFDPFFSTKGMHGDGLGLAIVEKCLEEHNGYVEIISAKEAGSIFSIFIPDTGEIDFDLDLPHLGISNGIKVLISEKDYIVRQMCTDMLVELSYKVTSVPSRAEALESISQDNDYDILIMNGDSSRIKPSEFFTEMSGIYSKLKLIFLTRDSSDKRFDEVASAENVVILEKPFTLDQLEASLLSLTNI